MTTQTREQPNTPESGVARLSELWCGKDSRFFIEHGFIHDRLTGKHVTVDEDSWTTPEGTQMPNPHGSGITATCALLNELAWAALPTQPSEDATMVLLVAHGGEDLCYYEIAKPDDVCATVERMNQRKTTQKEISAYVIATAAR